MCNKQNEPQISISFCFCCLFIFFSHIKHLILRLCYPIWTAELGIYKLNFLCSEWNKIQSMGSGSLVEWERPGIGIRRFRSHGIFWAVLWSEAEFILQDPSSLTQSHIGLSPSELLWQWLSVLHLSYVLSPVAHPFIHKDLLCEGNSET